MHVGVETASMNCARGEAPESTQPWTLINLLSTCVWIRPSFYSVICRTQSLYISFIVYGRQYIYLSIYSFCRFRFTCIST